MKRRLYFLFPDAAHARSAVDDLIRIPIGTSHMHAVAQPGVALDDLPQATTRQRRDLLHHLERVLWNTNLAVFFIALFGLLMVLDARASGWILVMLGVMILTFVMGVLATYLPDVRLDELRDALHHGEVLLLVDVPEERVAEVEANVHSHHPEAAVGGVSWTIERFGM